MDNYKANLAEEVQYLEKIVSFIEKEIVKEQDVLKGKKSQLLEARRDMWENTGHASRDFTKLTEMNQYLAGVNDQTANYLETVQQIARYEKMLAAPYFGRFDFIEEDFYEPEKIYVGLSTLIDESDNVYVYDWRAPIASIYYRYEPGHASYEAPEGEIAGEVLLKRQYKIQDSQLKYFFDCSILINDGMLQEILGGNASPKMRTIVETIQREQDLIIRDQDNELLIVQGVAGSGKTSIALHRVAFLLYNGLKTGLGSHNVMIISPNATFSNYISNVLPELGEENVQQTIFCEIARKAFGHRFQLETRESQLEALIQLQGTKEGQLREQNIALKGSQAFKEILDRYLWYYEHRLIPFEDVYFNGVMLETRQQLKNRLLNNKTGLPLAKRLQRLENILLDKVQPLRKQRLSRIEKIVQQSEGHDLEIKSFSRLLSMKEAKTFRERLQRFSRVDYWQLYLNLWQDPALFGKLARELPLPEGIEEIFTITGNELREGKISYEDQAPLLYLKMKMEGGSIFPEIKQVVIDEAQDYSPLQYEVFKMMFEAPNYTVLGDSHQAIEKKSDGTLYETVSQILHRQNTTQITLNKSYRSSYEINIFTQGLLSDVQPRYLSFERHEEEPRLVPAASADDQYQAMQEDVSHCLAQGYETIAIICKTQQEAAQVYAGLKERLPLKLIHPQGDAVEKGILVIPSYMAKGLEFDVVLVANADEANYHTPLDRRLLYIACTRAQHRLALYYTGFMSPFLSKRTDVKTDI